MSQAGESGGGGSPSSVQTINVDVGSISGSTLTIHAADAGGSVLLEATGPSTANLVSGDSNANLLFGNGTLPATSSSVGFNLIIAQAGSSGASITTGTENVMVGAYVGQSITSSSNNVSLGNSTLNSLVNGSGSNVAIGQDALETLGSGSYNIAIGAAAGFAYSGAESSNILLNSIGVTRDSNILRIGSGTGTENGDLNAAYICGITGVTVTGAAVLVSASNQLGVAISSRKYKDNIEDMNDFSSSILDLRPVTFNLKGDLARCSGLIAEEVQEVAPNLIVYDKYGDPQTVKYHELPALLLNELQKALKRIEVLEAKLGV